MCNMSIKEMFFLYSVTFFLYTKTYDPINKDKSIGLDPL